LIQESIAERLDIKRDAHQLIEQHAPSTAIIASSTSGLLASEMQKALKHPERFLIAHPFNPPHLVPLVELVSGPQTSAETLKNTYDFYTRLGKIPVVLNKEVPGHLANRLAAAVWREAIHLVASGVASLEDVDKALYAGPGLRWAFMGQHMVYHLGGGAGGYPAFFKHLGPAAETWIRDLASWDRIPETAQKEVLSQIDGATHGRSVAELERWRDEKLASLVRALYAT
jgi:carnitine 3-dehydrogenase